MRLFPLENCVVCAAMLWEGESMRTLVEHLGGTYSESLHDQCTHVITSRTNTSRYLLATKRYPNIPIVHPRWLWVCYWNLIKAPLDPYMTDFLHGTERAGTSTKHGTRATFLREVAIFHGIERRLNLQGTMLASKLHNDSCSEWGYISRQLQHTQFWGYIVRNMNWKRRRALMLLLTRCSARPGGKKYKAVVYNTRTMLCNMLGLPLVLQQHIIQFC